MMDHFEQDLKYFKEDIKLLQKANSKFVKAPSEEDFVLLRNRIDGCEN